jgi:speckle-type POZ protein
MAEQKACTVFPSRESKSFNLRVNNSATKHLSGDECINIDVSIPAAAGFTCTATYWPNWHSSGHIKIAVVITRTDDQHHPHRHKLLVAHIDLPARTGLTPPPVTVRRETITTDCNCNEGIVRREPVTTDCKDGTVKREPVTTDCCKEGISLIAKRVDVEAKCVVDDHFTAICTVAVPKFWPPVPLPTPSRLEHDIHKASDLTDVSFQVDGETFRAHRLVLAARSPVLRAELFGQTAEVQQASSPIAIQVQDMKASTFKSMLHYMYHGLLPAETAWPMSECQNLHVAADKYGLDTLKQTCEEILCASVTTDTVLSSLQFAEERACLKLKSRCLDFLADGEKFKAVAVTNEYIDLMKKVPSLLDHVQNRFKRPRLS